MNACNSKQDLFRSADLAGRIFACTAPSTGLTGYYLKILGHIITAVKLRQTVGS